LVVVAVLMALVAGVLVVVSVDHRNSDDHGAPVSTSMPLPEPVTTVPPTTVTPLPLTTTTGATPASTTPTTQLSPTSTGVMPSTVTVGPTFPSARPRQDVPWGTVGPGWSLVLYSGCSRPGGSEPHVVYLVSPAGDRYEVARIEGGCPREMHHRVLLDWAPTGHVALLEEGCCDSGAPFLLDLRTGALTRVPGNLTPVALTRPQGKALVVVAFDHDASTESLARVDRAGDVRVVFATWDWLGPRAYDAVLYQPGGAALVMGGGDGPLTLVMNNDPTARVPLATPGTSCTPLRWWDTTTVLARCWEPGRRSLWLVPTSGAPAQPLAAGYNDAFALGEDTVLNRSYQQGHDTFVELVEVRSPDGIITALNAATTQNRAVGTHDGRILLLEPSPTTGGTRLVSVDHDGTDPRVLVPAPGWHAEANRELIPRGRGIEYCLVAPATA
jgi:TolB protein